MEYEVRRFIKTGQYHTAQMLCELSMNRKYTSGESHLLDTQKYRPFSPLTFDPLVYAEVLIKKEEYGFAIEQLNIANSLLMCIEERMALFNEDPSKIYHINTDIVCTHCNQNMIKLSTNHICDAVCPTCHEVTELHTSNRKIHILSLLLLCCVKMRFSDDIVQLLTTYDCIVDNEPQFDTLAALPTQIIFEIAEYFKVDSRRRNIAISCYLMLIDRNRLDLYSLQKLAEFGHNFPPLYELYEENDICIPMLVETVQDLSYIETLGTIIYSTEIDLKNHENDDETSQPNENDENKRYLAHVVMSRMYFNVEETYKLYSKLNRRDLIVLNAEQMEVYLENRQKQEQIMDNKGEKIAPMLLQPTLNNVVKQIFHTFSKTSVLDYWSALPRLSPLITLFPTSPFLTSFHLFTSYQCQDADGIFLSYLNSVLKMYPRCLTSLDLLSFFFLKKRRMDVVHHLASVAVKISLSRPETWICIALSYFANNNRDAAFSTLESVIVRNKTHLNAHLVKAWLLMSIGNFKSALSVYTFIKGIIGEGRDLSIEANICNCYLEMKQYRTAINLAIGILRLCPNNPKAITLTGTVLAQSSLEYPENREKAQKAFRKALSMNPLCAIAAISLCKIYIKQGLHYDALKLMKNTNQFINSEFVHVEMGKIYTYLGEIADAGHHFRSALTLHPNFQPAIQGLIDLNREDVSSLDSINIDLNDTSILY